MECLTGIIAFVLYGIAIIIVVASSALAAVFILGWGVIILGKVADRVNSLNVDIPTPFTKTTKERGQALRKALGYDA